MNRFILSPIFYRNMQDIIKSFGFSNHFFDIKEIRFNDLDDVLKEKIKLEEIEEDASIDYVVYVKYLENTDYYYTFYILNTYDEFGEPITCLETIYVPGEVEYNVSISIFGKKIEISSIESQLINWLSNIEKLEESEFIPLLNEDFNEFSNKILDVENDHIDKKFNYEEIEKLKKDLEEFKKDLKKEQQAFFNEKSEEIEKIIARLENSSTTKTKRQWLKTLFLSAQELAKKNPAATTLLMTSVMGGATFPEIAKNTATGLLVDNIPGVKVKEVELDINK